MGTISIRIDDTLKANLQELTTKLGMDMTTFFTMAATQAVREQALPFAPKISTSDYTMKDYKFAIENTKYNPKGYPVVSNDDEWLEETEWDDLYEQMKKEKGI